MKEWPSDQPPCSGGSEGFTVVGIGPDGPIYSENETGEVGFCRPGPPDQPPYVPEGVLVDGRWDCSIKFADRNGNSGRAQGENVFGRPREARFSFYTVDNPEVYVAIVGPMPNGAMLVKLASLTAESFELKVKDSKGEKGTQFWQQAQDEQKSFIEEAFI